MDDSARSAEYDKIMALCNLGDLGNLTTEQLNNLTPDEAYDKLIELYRKLGERGSNLTTAKDFQLLCQLHEKVASRDIMSLIHTFKE